MTTDSQLPIRFFVAYWKKRWLGVPLLLELYKNIEEDGTIAKYKLIPLDGSTIEPSPRRECLFSQKVRVEEVINPATWSDKDLKTICRLNDILTGWVTNRFPREAYNRQNEPHRQKTRSHRVLTKGEYRRVQKELMQLNPQAALVIRILWFFNRSLGRGGGFITLEELLRLRVTDVSLGPPHDPGTITVRRDSYGSHMATFFLPQQLWNELERQISEHSSFVFSTRFGGPVLPSQVDKHLRKAARMAKILFPVSSLSLRTRDSEEQAKKYRTNTGNHSPFSEEDWQQLCRKFPPLSAQRGRKAQHSPGEILNALLWAKRMRKPLRQLPAEFPPYKAVESQQRRWRKTGFLDAVWTFCKERSRS